MFSQSTPEREESRPSHENKKEKEEEEDEEEEEEEEESDTDSLEAIFRSIQSTSEAANHIAHTSATTDDSDRKKTVFEQLKMLTGMPQPPERYGKRMRIVDIQLDPMVHPHYNDPRSPEKGHSYWESIRQFRSPSSMFTQPILETPQFTMNLPPPVIDLPLTDHALVRMKGPSRLINFLVHIAMNERARRALRWTGNGLEFILVNKELVAKMWGNRKHNTKDMDYYKLSRAIREKYDKRRDDGTINPGKLKKGTRTYSYVFTEHSYQDLESQTGMRVASIQDYAHQVGAMHRDNTDLNSNSPQAPSPQNSEE